MTSIRRASADDLPHILVLLRQSALPTDDLAEVDVAFFIGVREGKAVGVIGLQRFGSSALLRSLAVSPDHRGHRIASQLVEALESQARAQGIETLYLLTQTAERFFERRDFVVLPRDRAPVELQASAEFRSLCPTSAICMGKQLPASTD